MDVKYLKNIISCPFLVKDEVVRGTLFVLAFGSGNKSLYFFIDTIDDDMYLQAGNLV